MNYRLLVLLSFLFFLTNCSSPQKLYEKGKYFKAFDSVLGDLKGNKKNRKDVLLLNKSFSKMIDISRDNMVFLEDGYKVHDLEYNFEQYEEVDKRYVKGRSFLDDNNTVKYEKFNNEEITLVLDTYEEGNALLAFFEESKNKIDAQNAYYHFELVKQYGTGYNDVDQLIKDAQIAGTVIYNVDADLDSDFSYQWDVDRKFDNLEGEEGFVQIVYDNSYVDGDCYVELDFSRLDVDESDNESVQNYTKKIIDGYTTTVDTSGKTIKKPIYKEVSGSVTTVSIRKTVSWIVDIEITKSNVNCNLRQDRFKASVVDQVEIHEIKGDERAVPSEYLSNSNENIEDTDDMVDELLEILYDKIRNYFY
jgi:hypothetical protein